MKILVVSNLYPPNSFGGAEILTQNLVAGFMRSHEVAVLTSKSNHRHPKHVFPWLKLWTPYPDRLKQDPKSMVIGAWYMLGNFIKTFFAIWRFKPHVIFISDLKRVNFGPLMAAQWMRPTLAFVHDLHSFNIGERCQGWRGWLRHIAGILIFFGPQRVQYALSNSLHTLKLQPATVTIQKSKVVRVGIRPPNAMPRNTKPENRVSLLFIGRIERVKGIHDIIEALARLKKDHPDIPFELKIAGFENDMTYKKELVSQVEKHGIGHQVFFLGRVDEPQKWELYCGASIFVFSSNWDEGHGQTYLEAMYCRTPCVCSAAGGSLETLKHGENCIQYQPGDIDGLVRGIKAIITNKGLVQKIIDHAEHMVQSEFMHDQFTSRVEKAMIDFELFQDNKLSIPDK